MANFSYKAVTRHGQVNSGSLDAANPIDLEQRLGKMGLDLISCRPQAQGKFLLGRQRVGRPELINFCFHMEEFIRAGVPLLDSLGDMRDSMDHLRFREVIANVIDEVEGGKTLSEAMREHPTVFDSLFIHLILAGEASGKLAEVFASLTAMLKWQDELAAQTKKILLFPAFVALVVTGVTFFLMVYLVPQLVSFIKEMGQVLPLHTRALIMVSNFFIHYWAVVLLTPPLLVAALQLWIRINPRARYHFDDWKLRLWFLGPVLKKIILSRFANFFAMLYAAGIPVLHCLEISQGVVDNVVVGAALRQIGEDIGAGDDIATSFGKTGLFPALVIRMMKVGEATGELDRSLLNMSYFYDREVKELIGKLQTMIEPIMTVILGAVLGWVMLSVLGPIYDTIGKIKF